MSRSFWVLWCFPMYEADAYFPNLDEDPDWEITAESEEQTYFDLEYAFVKYERKDR